MFRSIVYSVTYQNIHTCIYAPISLTNVVYNVMGDNKITAIIKNTHNPFMYREVVLKSHLNFFMVYVRNRRNIYEDRCDSFFGDLTYFVLCIF